jgi:phosphatidylglycerophosphatase A
MAAFASPSGMKAFHLQSGTHEFLMAIFMSLKLKYYPKVFATKNAKKKKLKISGWDVHWSGFWNFDSSFLAFDPA